MNISSEYWSLLQQYELIWTTRKCAFAHDSFRSRLPELVRRVIERNRTHLSPKQCQLLAQITTEMQQDYPLSNSLLLTQCGDLNSHGTYLSKLIENEEYTWLNAPWFLAELYLFYLILVVTGYFDTGVDPFHPLYVYFMCDTIECLGSIMLIYG